MKRMVGCWVGLAGLVLVAGCGREALPPPPKPAVLFAAHFAGTDAIGRSPGGGKIKEICALAASQRLVDQTLGKLAAAPQKLLVHRINTAHVDRAPLFRPLLEDLLRSESVVQCVGATNLVPEWALAVRLSGERMRIWETNLLALVQGWEMGAVTSNGVAGYPGWSVRKHHEPNLLQVVRAGDWLIAGLGQDKLSLLGEFAERIRASGKPRGQSSTNWLEMSADWPRLAHWMPASQAWRLPSMELSVAGRGESLRVAGRIVSDTPLAQERLPGWQVPTNAVREPLVSFAAARGINGWLGRIPWVQQLGLNPLPDQYFVWAQGDVPFQTFVGVQIQNPTNALSQLAGRIPSFITPEARKRGMGEIKWGAKTNEIVWEGLPFVAPFIRANPAADPNLLLAGVFPASANEATLPAELLKQIIGRSDLAVYAWEVTQPRIAQWRALLQLPKVVQNLPLLPPESAGQRWFENLLDPGTDAAAGAAILNWPNTVTEVTVRSAGQLEVQRSAPLGLSALELVRLVHWLDEPEFPLMGYALPSRSDRGQPARKP